MASVNHAWSHFANQMGKKHSKPLAARHAVCESAFTRHDMVQIHSATKKGQLELFFSGTPIWISYVFEINHSTTIPLIR